MPMETERKWVVLFTLIHIVIFCVWIDIIAFGYGIMALYALNMFMLIQQMTAPKKRLTRRAPVIRCDNLIKQDMSHSTSVEFRINLYVNRWKQVHMYHPETFPLDRLAYLAAKYYTCNKGRVRYLPHSPVKSLAKQQVQPNVVDAVHPLKMVTDFFATYVHRRAMFYRSRNTCAVEKRQYTKASLDQKQTLRLFPNSDCLLYPKKSSLKGDAAQPEFELLPSREAIPSPDKKEMKRGLLEKLSDVYDLFVGGVKLREYAKVQPPKKHFKSKVSDKENTADDEFEFSLLTEF